MSEDTKPRGKGGPRAGSGRKPGSPNKIVHEVRVLAQQYGEAAVRTLAELMVTSDDKTKVAAAKELLDRGYGKATQFIATEQDKPLEINHNIADEFTRRISSIAERERAREGNGEADV